MDRSVQVLTLHLHEDLKIVLLVLKSRSLISLFPPSQSLQLLRGGGVAGGRVCVCVFVCAYVCVCVRVCLAKCMYVCALNEYSHHALDVTTT